MCTELANEFITVKLKQSTNGYGGERAVRKTMRVGGKVSKHGTDWLRLAEMRVSELCGTLQVLCGDRSVLS